MTYDELSPEDREDLAREVHLLRTHHHRMSECFAGTRPFDELHCNRLGRDMCERHVEALAKRMGFTGHLNDVP